MQGSQILCQGSDRGALLACTLPDECFGTKPLRDLLGGDAAKCLPEAALHFAFPTVVRTNAQSWESLREAEQMRGAARAPAEIHGATRPSCHLFPSLQITQRLARGEYCRNLCQMLRECTTMWDGDSSSHLACTWGACTSGGEVGASMAVQSLFPQKAAGDALLSMAGGSLGREEAW